MQLPLHYLIILIGIGLITGCQSLDTRPADLNAYLQQFIGQNTTDIQKSLDFSALGYKVSQTVKTTDDELSYTILRPLSIPISGGNATVGSNAMGAPVIRYDTTAMPSYDVNFNCTVTFKLKQHIAESIQYSGRAC